MNTQINDNVLNNCHMSKVGACRSLLICLFDEISLWMADCIIFNTQDNLCVIIRCILHLPKGVSRLNYLQLNLPYSCSVKSNQCRQ